MNIIIFAQSLKNDGTGELVYNNKYIDSDSERKKIDLSSSHKRVKRLIKSNRKESVKYICTNRFLLIEVLSDELDNIGRLSPIIIESNYENLKDINKMLDLFLEKTGRHLSKEKRKSINQVITETEIRIKKFRFFKAILIGGLICGGGMAIYSNSNKVISNTLVGFVSGAVLSAITFYTTKKFNKGDKND